MLFVPPTSSRGRAPALCRAAAAVSGGVSEKWDRLATEAIYSAGLVRLAALTAKNAKRAGVIRQMQEGSGIGHKAT